MDRIVYRLTLDATKGGIQKILQGFNTGEDLARRIVVNLVANGKPLTLDERYVASMYVTKPNMNIPCINECVIEENQIIYDVPGTDIDAEGIVKMKLKVIDDDMVLMSPTFALEVLESEADDTEATDTPTYTALEQALLKATEVYNSRITSVSLEEDNVFRINYSDGTVYESDVLVPLLEVEEKELERIASEEERIEAEAERKASFARMLNDFDTFCNNVKYVDNVLSLMHDNEVLAQITLSNGGNLAVDSALDENSANAVANKVVAKGLTNIQTTSKGTLSQAGWYRVAEYTCGFESAAVVKGCGGNSCTLTIKRNINNDNNEYMMLRLRSLGHSKQEFVLLDGKSYVQRISKIRYTHDSKTKAYLEIYYNADVGNQTFFTVTDTQDTWGTWKAITPTLTEETLDGVTVTTTYDIPANASPFTTAGGTINDSVSLRSAEAKHIAMNVANSAKDVGIRVYENGIAEFYDYTNAKNIFRNAADGTNTFNGTATGNFPKTGGSITGSVKIDHTDIVPLSLENKSGTTAYIAFSNKNSLMGMLGFGEKNTPVYYDGDWTARYDLIHTGNIGSYALPKTGGTVSGDVVCYTNDTSVRTLSVANSLRSIVNRVYANGDYQMYDNTNKNTIIASTADGKTNTFNGTASGNLPLSGGRLSKNKIISLEIENTVSNASLIDFYGADGRLGALGFNGKNVPIYQPSEGGAHTLHHDGNSAKVVVSASAPSDTSAVWFDTSA